MELHVPGSGRCRREFQSRWGVISGHIELDELKDLEQIVQSVTTSIQTYLEMRCGYEIRGIEQSFKLSPGPHLECAVITLA